MTHLFRATVMTASLFALVGCDLSAAALDYTERYCAASGCAAQTDAGSVAESDAGSAGRPDAGSDAGAPSLRGDTVLFRANPETTFLVLRLEVLPESRGGDTLTFIEERRLTDGALVASQPLAELGLALSTNATFHGGLSRSGDGRSVAVMLYDGSRRVVDVVQDTTVRRVLQVRRTGLDWSTTIADAFPGEQVFSAATQDGTTFWFSGNAGADESELREVAFGSSGTSRFVFRGAPFLSFMSVVAGRLLTSRWLNSSVVSGIDDLGDAGAPLAVATPQRRVSLTGTQRAVGFAALDLNPAVPGPDTLYVPSIVRGPALRKLIFDGTRWQQVWTASSATAQRPGDGCLHVAARQEAAGVVVLCTAENDSAREVVRFDDFGAGDAGPSPRLLARIEGDGRDGGVSAIFRGVAFSPD
jgi:hypothetical protein